jgi:hypothetical protein
MKLVLQRAFGDCAIAAIATWTETTYEDVYVAAALIDKKYRGRSGVHLAAIQRILKILGVSVKPVRERNLDDDEGLLVVTWTAGSRHESGTDHLVALAHGIIVDPADGLILPADEYLAREQANPGTLLVEA